MIKIGKFLSVILSVVMLFACTFSVAAEELESAKTFGAELSRAVWKTQYTSETDSVTLGWNKVSGAQGYRIYRYKGGKWTKIATLSGANSLSFTDGGLSAGKVYRYKVKAYAKSGNSTVWGKASDEKRAAAKPETVKITSADYTSTSVTLNWKKVVGSGYQIFRLNGDKWEKIDVLRNSESVSYTVKGLKEATAYSFKIRAYASDGAGKNVFGKCGRTDTATKSSDYVENLILHMSLYEKVCQMFIVTPESLKGSSATSTSVDSALKKAIKKYPVGGVIYFSANLQSVSQTKKMIKNTQSAAKNSCGVGMFIAVDEEGGSVARCAQKLGTTKFKNMSYYGARNNTSEVENIGKTIGSDISEIGFNVDFAPVADVDINPNNELGSRIFSSDPKVVSSLSASFVKGIQSRNVSATLKHFPGLGAAGGNTHTDGSVYITRSMKQLKNSEFKAFSGGISAGAEFVMVGHQIVSAAGDNLPSDLSKTVVTDWLRGELNYDGIVVTDSQSMNTVTSRYSSGAAAVKSVKAGVDVILMPKKPSEAINAVYKAVKKGEITEARIDESLRRILTVKHKKGLC